MTPPRILENGQAALQASERARRLADTHKVIATILELTLEESSLDDLLQKALDLILWIPWLSIERKGAIFVVEHEPDALVMKVSRGMSDSLLATCARVSFGSCLCGQAAASRRPLYAANLDERHTTRYSGIAPHGHYCIPIRVGDRTLGVITTYLVRGHEPSAIDLEFLMAVADALAGVLIQRRADLRTPDGIGTWFGLPEAESRLIEADRESSEMSRSEYLLDLLHQRARELRTKR